MEPMRYGVIIWALAVFQSGAIAEPIVVIDPGHGGSNRGAYGFYIGAYEKDLTLRYARDVARSLSTILPGTKVMLTRDDDRFMSLYDRVSFANDHAATLFISLHCNASPLRNQQGFESYVLTVEEAQKSVQRLLLFELFGTTPSRIETPPYHEQFRRELLYYEQHRRSAQLAEALHATHLSRHPQRIDRGIRQGSFDVLRGLKMPSVLIELGFIDHPIEGEELVRDAFRQRMAHTIAQGIARYLKQISVDSLTTNTPSR